MTCSPITTKSLHTAAAPAAKAELSFFFPAYKNKDSELTWELMSHAKHQRPVLVTN